MTIQEALELLKDDKLADGEADADKFNEAYGMAIRSLEAWKKVKEEIKNAKPVYPDRVRIWGTDTILALIDKHLQEVENDK